MLLSDKNGIKYYDYIGRFQFLNIFKGNFIQNIPKTAESEATNEKTHQTDVAIKRIVYERLSDRENISWNIQQKLLSRVQKVIKQFEILNEVTKYLGSTNCSNLILWKSFYSLFALCW